MKKALKVFNASKSSMVANSDAARSPVIEPLPEQQWSDEQAQLFGKLTRSMSGAITMNTGWRLDYLKKKYTALRSQLLRGCGVIGINF